MSNTTPEATEPTDATTEPDEATQPDTDTAETSDPGREAAKYRRRLRETETERDTLASRVEATQKQMVDHLAQATGRIRPEALWASGAKLADLVDEAGNVDVVKVAAACENAVRLLGLSRTPRPDRSQGMAGSSERTFADAFRHPV